MPKKVASDKDGKQRGLRTLTRLSQPPQQIKNVPVTLIGLLCRGDGYYLAARTRVRVARKRLADGRVRVSRTCSLGCDLVGGRWLGGSRSDSQTAWRARKESKAVQSRLGRGIVRVDVLNVKTCQ